MSRRLLLSAPPAYLGYRELRSWQSAEAFEDLLADCYLFAIVRRIKGLRNQLLVRTAIEGLITRNVRNFLFERQMKYDPVGYATFGNVEGAADALEAEKEVVVESKIEGRLEGPSVIHFLKSPGGTAPEPETLRTILEAMPGWSEILPHLAYTTELGQEWVAVYLRQLAAAGIASVRVSKLIPVLATRTRTDWQARHATSSDDVALEGGEDEVARVVQLVFAGSEAEDRDRWEMWKKAIPAEIAQVEETAQRGRLVNEFNAIVQLIESGETPSQADLTRELGVPRNTVSRDFARLRQIIEEIQRRSGTNSPGGS